MGFPLGSKSSREADPQSASSDFEMEGLRHSPAKSRRAFGVDLADPRLHDFTRIALVLGRIRFFHTGLHGRGPEKNARRPARSLYNSSPSPGLYANGRHPAGPLSPLLFEKTALGVDGHRANGSQYGT